MTTQAMTTHKMGCSCPFLRVPSSFLDDCTGGLNSIDGPVLGASCSCGGADGCGSTGGAVGFFGGIDACGLAEADGFGEMDGGLL